MPPRPAPMIVTVVACAGWFMRGSLQRSLWGPPNDWAHGPTSAAESLRGRDRGPFRFGASRASRFSRTRSRELSATGCDRSVARHECAPLFIPELEAVGVKRKRRGPGKHHHQLAIADRLLARSAQRSIARTPGNRVLNLMARQPFIMKLRLNEARERFRGRLLHRVAKVGHGDLRFPHEEIGALEQLMGLLHQFPGILASLASSMPYDFGGVAARVEVLTYRLDQFRLTTRTDRSFVRLETVCGQLKEPRMLGARGTHDRMRPAIPVQKGSLLMCQAARATTINVGDGRAVGLDHIVGRDRSSTAWACRLGGHRYGQASHAGAWIVKLDDSPRLRAARCRRQGARRPVRSRARSRRPRHRPSPGPDILPAYRRSHTPRAVDRRSRLPAPRRGRGGSSPARSPPAGRARSSLRASQPMPSARRR